MIYKLKNKDAALDACVTLVEAYCRDPQDVDWSDVQSALDSALKALGLPSDYPETEHEKRNAE